MGEKVSVRIEEVCPKCEAIFSYSISSPGDYPKTCPFCQADLRAPNPDGISMMLEERRIKAEREAFMKEKYGHLKPEDMTDELREEMRRDEQRFQEALDEVTPTRFGTVAQVRRRMAELREKKEKT